MLVRNVAFKSIFRPRPPVQTAYPPFSQFPRHVAAAYSSDRLNDRGDKKVP